MEVIHKTLKQNGTRINIGKSIFNVTKTPLSSSLAFFFIQGPLLYHFEDSSNGDSSIELSLEQVKEVAKKIGFEFKVSVFQGVK
jgi:carnosine N-methyltransferase